eukprot:6785354-Alexandrium_andersonii.AAC.1
MPRETVHEDIGSLPNRQISIHQSRAPFRSLELAQLPSSAQLSLVSTSLFFLSDAAWVRTASAASAAAEKGTKGTTEGGQGRAKKEKQIHQRTRPAGLLATNDRRGP